MINFKEYINFISENMQPTLLSEGGASGHMMHLYDDKSLTFGELKKIISDVFSGNVEITAKTDGQNINITYKDGKVGLARNKSTVINPMSVQQTYSKFEGRGEIQKAFVNSLIAIESALNKVDKSKLDKWFQNGKRFMSMEVIYPPTKNVIDYGNRCMLMIHNLTEYDEKGNKVAEYPEFANEIFNVLRSKGATNQGEFEITGPQVLSIKDTVTASKELDNITNQINNFEIANNLKDSNTIEDYIVSEYTKKIKEISNIEIPDNILDVLIKRFVLRDKSIDKRNILKLVKESGIDQSKFIEVFNLLEKESGKIYSDILYPLEMIIFKSGALFLKCLSGFVSANPDETIRKLKAEVEETLKQFEKEPDLPERLIKQIEKLNSIGLDNIVPEEGIVFKHGDNVFKITGVFAPINQILGWLKFKRG